MVLHPHEIPLVPADQSRASTVNNCVDVLLHLEKVVDDVFNSITSRLQETSCRLQNLKERAATAQAKVDKLTGASKATQVFSSSQYPGRDKYELYHPVHKGESPIPFTSTPVKVKEDIHLTPATLQVSYMYFRYSTSKLYVLQLLYK
nr:WASH complex subunit 1-like [Cherax quadricarinatus]